MADSQSSVQGAYGPVDSPLGEIPEILNSDPDLQHAWKVVNWVYDTKNYMQGIRRKGCCRGMCADMIKRATTGNAILETTQEGHSDTDCGPPAGWIEDTGRYGARQVHGPTRV